MSKPSDASLKKPAEKPDDEAPHHGLRAQFNFLKEFWVAPETKKKARWMLVGIIGLTVAEIGLTAGIGFGFKFAIDAMLGQNLLNFGLAGGAILGATVANSFTANGREYLTNNLGQNWRGWLTSQFTKAWLDGKSYLRLQHDKKYAQNPDQRIAETIGNVTGTTLSLGLGLMRSAVSMVAFGAVLWHIAPIMVGAAVVCSAVAHGMTHWTGGSMRKIWRSLMDTEAKFRHALVRVRDNAKTIALAGYEPVENHTLKEEFNSLDGKRREFYKHNWRVGLVSSLNWGLASIVPVALYAPKFFAVGAKVAELAGDLELVRQSYGQFYQAISWFPQGYTQIAGWQANVSQLMDFKQDLEDNKADITVKKAAEQKPAPAPVVPAPAPAMVTPPRLAPAGPAP